MEEDKKPVITLTLAKIAENELNKCLNNGKAPSKRLLDTLKILKEFNS